MWIVTRESVFAIVLPSRPPSMPPNGPTFNGRHRASRPSIYQNARCWKLNRAKVIPVQEKDLRLAQGAEDELANHVDNPAQTPMKDGQP